MRLQIGTRVEPTEDVERYPHGIARRGATGTVTRVAESDGGLEGVTLDNAPDWLDEWNGELQWYGHNDDGGTMTAQVRLVNMGGTHDNTEKH